MSQGEELEEEQQGGWGWGLAGADVPRAPLEFLGEGTSPFAREECALSSRVSCSHVPPAVPQAEPRAPEGTSAEREWRGLLGASDPAHLQPLHDRAPRSPFSKRLLRVTSLEASSSHTGTFSARLCPRTGMETDPAIEGPKHLGRDLPTPTAQSTLPVGGESGRTLVETTPGVTGGDRWAPGWVTGKFCTWRLLCNFIYKFSPRTCIRHCDSQAGHSSRSGLSLSGAALRTVCPFKPLRPGVPDSVSL